MPNRCKPKVTYRLVVDRTWDGISIDAGERAEVSLTLRPLEQLLQVDYAAALHHDPAPHAAAGELDGLWDYEVVELFLFARKASTTGSGEVRPSYIELEVGPHGHFLALAFSAPRQRSRRIEPVQHLCDRQENCWTARLILRYCDLPAANTGRLLANAFALHGPGRHYPQRRYLACRPVVGSSPDFHRIDAAAALETFENERF